MKILNSIWNYIFDIGGARTESVISYSITGKPLVKCKSDMYGWSIWNTDEGIRSSFISTNIKQLGDNTKSIKLLLKDELDDYLSKEQKDGLIRYVNEIVSCGGFYYDTKRNSQGTLDIVKVKWQYEDLKEIKSLLSEV